MVRIGVWSLPVQTLQWQRSGVELFSSFLPVCASAVPSAHRPSNLRVRNNLKSHTMTILVTLSLISWAMTLALFFASWISKSEDVAMLTVLWFVFIFGVHVFFQVGAAWQHKNTLDKYILTEEP